MAEHKAQSQRLERDAKPSSALGDRGSLERRGIYIEHCDRIPAVVQAQIDAIFENLGTKNWDQELTEMTDKFCKSFEMLKHMQGGEEEYAEMLSNTIRDIDSQELLILQRYAGKVSLISSKSSVYLIFFPVASLASVSCSPSETTLGSPSRRRSSGSGLKGGRCLSTEYRYRLSKAATFSDSRRAIWL